MNLIALLCAAELFVAPNGNDDNPGTLTQPLKTLEAARGAKTVFVRGGLYELERPLKLDAKDSGATWRAYKNEKPVVIGGRQITGFVPHKGDILKATAIKGVNFRQLFFDGKRMHLARYPNFDPKNPYGGGWAYADGKPVPMYAEVPGENRHSLHYKIADARDWSRADEGEVFVFPRYNWWNNIVRIKTIDRDTRTITLAGSCSYPIRPTDRYYVRGMFEELDAPGEWYLDKKDWTLYFWPPAPLKGKAVYAPTLRTLIEIGSGATNITFRGFTFECCEGTAITMKNTTNCLIAACIIRNAGDYGGNGVSVDGGRANGVVGCDISEIGRSAISLSGGDRITLTPGDNFADNNYIHHTGVFYKQGVGVSLTGVGNRASHNYIHDCPRFGIQFSGNNLLIEFNHIRHVNLETADTGAVYTGGRDWISSRGTVIRHNYFHDILGYGQEKGKWVSPHYAWGVYLDDNAGGVDVIGNIVARSINGLVHFHNARDNRVENNIFIDGKLQQFNANGWTPAHRYWTNHLPSMVKGYESVANQPAWKQMRNMNLHPTNAVLPNGLIMSGNVVCRNIFYYRIPDAKLYALNRMSLDHNLFDSNLVWHAGLGASRHHNNCSREPARGGEGFALSTEAASRLAATGKRKQDDSAEIRSAGLPILTGHQKLKNVDGPNLVPNGDFENGQPGKEPTNWKWQIRPTGSKAAIDDTVRFAGKQSLRIEGRGTTTDASGRKLSPNYVSADIQAKPGQLYRLTARIKAAAPGTKFAMMAQSYQDKKWFWSKDTSTTAVTDWKEYEVTFKFPAPGESAYREGMSTFRIRFDIRQSEGTIWVDDVTLREAVALDEWASWQATGQDAHSMIADPLFANPDKDDYRLQRNSPAFKLGFKPIPVEKIGPYRHELRATWPIKEAEGAREHPLVSEAHE